MLMAVEDSNRRRIGMRRLIALTTVVAALGVGATSATAAPDSFAQAARLCERQGGTFGTNILGYSCNSSEAFDARELTQATRLCNRIGGGLITFSAVQYGCILI
jgi:hypothetical protein